MTTVRPAGPADVARLQAVEDAADVQLRSWLGADEWWPAPSGAERAVVPGFLLVAADADPGDVVGFAHVLEPDGFAHLEQLSVLPEHGRRGVGRALVDAAMAEAAACGHRRLTLRTYADVPFNAPFYARLGFVESQPDGAFLRGLVEQEERLGLQRYGRRVQMTAPLPTPGG